MKQLPPIPQGEMIFVGGSFLAAIGFTYGLLQQSFFAILWGLLFFPMIGMLCIALASLYLYYVGSYLSKKNLSYERMFNALFLAAIPSCLFLVVSPILKSAALLGFVLSAFLLRMALIYSFSIDRRHANQMIGSLFAVVLIGYLIEWFQTYHLMSRL